MNSNSVPIDEYELNVTLLKVYTFSIIGNLKATYDFGNTKIQTYTQTQSQTFRQTQTHKHTHLGHIVYVSIILKFWHECR